MVTRSNSLCTVVFSEQLAELTLINLLFKSDERFQVNGITGKSYCIV